MFHNRKRDPEHLRLLKKLLPQRHVQFEKIADPWRLPLVLKSFVLFSTKINFENVKKKINKREREGKREKTERQKIKTFSIIYLAKKITFVVNSD